MGFWKRKPEPPAPAHLYVSIAYASRGDDAVNRLRAAAAAHGVRLEEVQTWRASGSARVACGRMPYAGDGVPVVEGDPIPLDPGEASSIAGLLRGVAGDGSFVLESHLGDADDVRSEHELTVEALTKLLEARTLVCGVRYVVVPNAA